MSIFNGTPETLASLVTDGIKARLYTAVRDRLNAELAPLVESTARQVAESLVAQVRTVNNIQNDRMEVQVAFSTKAEEAVKRVANGLR